METRDNHGNQNLLKKGDILTLAKGEDISTLG